MIGNYITDTTNKDDVQSDNLLHYLIEHGDVSLYSCQTKDFPDVLLNKKFGRVSVFVKKQEKDTSLPNYFFFGNYDDMSDIKQSDTEVCFLDKGAIKALFIRLPVRPKYVLVRLKPRISWILGLLGLLRRIIKKQVVVQGICKLSAGQKTKMWLVLKVANLKLRSSFTLSEKVGIQGFLDYLRQEKINYVILRFFEKLPKPYRKGGDLDILVSDKDWGRLTSFLERRRGSIPLDIRSVSGLQFSDTPYYPPPIARKILDSAINGPAGSRIPAPKELFLSFAYHLLYHKGEDAGIPSNTPGIVVNKNTKHDYAGAIEKMAKKIGLDVDITMEALDDYLENERWRPRIDSLARITGWNEWVKQRFFSQKNIKEIGLSVFILKEKALRLNLLDPILAAIKKEKFNIIRHKLFSEQEQKNVADSLRGGNWTDGRELEKEELFYPKAAIVVLDLYFLYTENRDVNSGYHNRISFLKKKIRSKFDQGKISLIHSTDNTNEAWEYVKVCFPKESESIKQDVHELYTKFKPSFLEKVKLHFKAATYHKTMLVSRAKEFVIGRLTK